MVKTVASVGLPVDEVLEIKKNHITPVNQVKGKRRGSVLSPGFMGMNWKGSMSVLN